MVDAPAGACPADDELVAFVEGALDPPAAQAFEEHLDACADCSRLIATYARVYLTDGGSSEDAAASSTSSEGDREVVRRLQRARTLAPGAVVGRYVVLDCIGEGASSIVYGAYDPELDRKVALKVLRATHGREGVAAREAQLREARAMAKLSHPNIVVVHDVGADAERVFIAMEHVDGPTLRAWLAQRERTTEAILAALVEAGRGLCAVHAAGLVHRDFKPENVLIDKEGHARVTDLGLARVLREGSPDATPGGGAGEAARPPASAATGAWTNAIAGTPAYMAPEQSAGRGADARSNQYAFAVTLYEALFGERPTRDGEGAPRLHSVPPRAKPSTRPDAPKAAGRRVSKRVRAVLARGLAPRPGDRFPSMKEVLRALEADGARTRRILAAIAVTAGVALAAAGLSRMLGPSRVCTQAAAEMQGVWDAGRKQLVAAAFRATRAPYAEDAWRGVDRAADAYAAAWVAARTDACEATRVRGDQSDALLTLRMDCLDRRRRELAAVTTLFAEADAPVVEHAVAAMGRLPPIAACSDTAALLARVRPPESPEVKRQVEALRDELGRVRALEASGKSAAALPDARAAVARAKALGYRPVEAEALYLRGTIERSTGDFAAAVPTLFEAVSAAEAGKHDELAAEVWATLVELLGDLDRFDEAKLCVERARAGIERTAGAGRAPLVLPDALGTMYREMGRYPEAIEQHRAAIAVEERALGGAQHLDVARSLNDLANALRDNGDAPAALDAYQRSLAIQEQLLGPEHPEVAATLQGLAIFYSRLGRYEEAKPVFLRALAIREQTLGKDHPTVGETLSSLVVAMRWSGEAAAALPLAERALRIEEAAYGRSHDNTAGAENNVGFVQIALHDYAAARASLGRSLEIRERVLGPDHPKVGVVLGNLGQTALAEKDYAGALALYGRALAIDEKSLKKGHPDAAYALVGLGLSDLGLGKAAEAVPLLERAVGLREKNQVQPRTLADARFALARALWEAGDAGRDRARAREIASQARAGYAAAGKAFAQEEADVAAWISAHPAT